MFSKQIKGAYLGTGDLCLIHPNATQTQSILTMYDTSLKQRKIWILNKHKFKDIFLSVFLSTMRRTSLVAWMVKNLPAMKETWVSSPDWEDPLEEGMITHSGILAWRIPWTEEPGGLQSKGSQRVEHDWSTKHSYH